jgi:hypothetical protein
MHAEPSFPRRRYRILEVLADLALITSRKDGQDVYNLQRAREVRSLDPLAVCAAMTAASVSALHFGNLLTGQPPAYYRADD